MKTTTKLLLAVFTVIFASCAPQTGGYRVSESVPVSRQQTTYPRATPVSAGGGYREIKDAMDTGQDGLRELQETVKEFKRLRDWLRY